MPKIEKLLLTAVYKNDKDKSGQPFITQKGKPFWKIAIKAKEYGNEYLSSLIFEPDDILHTWKASQVVSVIVEKKGAYLNFRMPNEKDYLEMKLEEFDVRLKAVENFCQNREVPAMPDEPVIHSEDKIKVEDLPF